MALVRKISLKELNRNAKHTEVEATVSLIETPDGEKFVQIDTYGSVDRALPGKTSQSLRLSKAAFEQIAAYADKHF